jgi:aspartate-semialdehyde dehydrogenase
MAKTTERIAIVGGDSLLAREIREVWDTQEPKPRVLLISAAADNAAVLSEEDGEAVAMSPLTSESLEGMAVAMLAGSAAASRRALKMNPPGGPVLIDLAGSLEDQHEARLRAPSAEVPGSKHQKTTIQVIAHPAAIALTMLLARLSGVQKIKSSIVHVFEPASERGQQGIEELRKQTVGVLSFQKLDQTVFDTQLAFNMLAQYGEEATEPLEGIEERIERDSASLLAAWPGLPMPSIRLIQAPVFHGYSFSVWVEFDGDVDTGAIAKGLEQFGIDVRPDEPPANAQIAGQSGLSVGAIRMDRNHPRAVWLWLVVDNLRLSAENAVAVAKELL